MGRNKNAILGFLKDKMLKRIQSWEGRLLSKADRKQGWRLLLYEDSLVGRIYRARYYPNGNFLTAEIGDNPSFIWRNVFESQQLVRDGARRRIGSGMFTLVLNVPWLISDVNPCVVSTHPALANSTVSQLMHIDRKQWDLEVLHDLFEARDIGLIMQLESELWRALWKVKVPPKVLHFVWKAISGCLPTRSQLRNKHVPVDPRCVICNSDEETIVHVFVGCHFAQSCWNRSGVGLQFSAEATFADWFKAFLVGVEWPWWMSY
ncbi:uncharacterized protein LOC115702106 [Cannabis sativa]|uniref:uncharacterized protein LOC115702106 n=1 Tax=Cannabis sativa TaxID=3483 RepID=UPI0029C9E296|nr:uncharacterized protein LOC115702106 [Cannabis sativa]